jgi:hypothetical protein
VCNLRSMVSNQKAMRPFFKITKDITGNLGPLPGIYPDYAAPMVRNSPGGPEMLMARWGMPTRPSVVPSTPAASRAARMGARLRATVRCLPLRQKDREQSRRPGNDEENPGKAQHNG